MTESTPLIPSFSHLDRHNELLISTLKEFGDDDWRKPSYCPGWTAAHVIGHMTLGAHFYAHTVRNGQEGVQSIPFGAKDIPEFRQIRAARMEELTALSGEERIGRFQESVDGLQEAFASILPDNLDKPAWHPRCPTPIRLFPTQRFYELILHGWDIRNEPETSIIPEGLDHGAEILKERLPFFYNQAPDPDLEGFFRLETTDPAHAWGLEIRNRSAALRPPDGTGADVRLTASASDMILLACGRADIQARRASGALRIEGSEEKAEAFLKIFFSSF